MPFIRFAAVALALSASLVACTGATPTPSPAPTNSPAPSSTPSPPPGTGSVVVTFQVGNEQYRILLTDPDDIDIAQLLLDGVEAPKIPNGRIVRGETSVNEGWSWSIDPDSLEFADMTTEVCDGLPSYVEDGSLTGAYFCPWSAKIIDLAPAG